MRAAILRDSDSIAIVNRGEAALRFIRGVREYNSLHGTSLKTVAFYTGMEEDALFVKMADDALLLSDLPAFPGKQKSPYLDHELLRDGIEQMGCRGVWAGWGFVSEDADFVQKLEECGLVFLGPDSKAMALLGDKIKAKGLAERANVPILPWSRRRVRDVEDARHIAEDIGYPVIVKASNAGGGRGIRFVKEPQELTRQFQSARQETLRITGKDVLFMEALVERGRHLEVQCLADRHGHINTFGVRDCSIQRKNQKIIEETPPAALPAPLLKEMEEAAGRLIREADYTGAGTVEYLYDLDRKTFYFMEVNTRLQVEHPITETLYDIDLVKGQIDVARGKEVDLRDRKPFGAVMEVRLNAEDPDRDFSPAPGKVKLFRPPSGPGIRVDSGIEEGSVIPGDFDSMTAKIIARGADRPEALARLKEALRALRIHIDNGCTNRALLMELLDSKEIRAGGVSTSFVESWLQSRSLFPGEEKNRIALLAGAVELYNQKFSRDYLNFREQLTRLGRPRNLTEGKGYVIHLSCKGNSYTFQVCYQGENRYHIRWKDQELTCCCKGRGQEFVLLFEDRAYNILMVPRAGRLQCEVDGFPVMLDSESGGAVVSPSPAIVLSLQVKPGQNVHKGDVLAILEAMKMEMLVEAPGKGLVKEILVSPGCQVKAGQVLCLLDLKGDGERPENPASAILEFTGKEEKVQNKFQGLLRELNALFRGFDYRTSPQELWKGILAHIRSYPQEKDTLKSFIFQTMEAFTVLEKLFANQELDTESFARPVSYQEMLSHYFLRHEEKLKGLPPQFIQELEASTAFYHDRDASEEEKERALYHIFQSHGRIKIKLSILREMLFSLPDMEIKEEEKPFLLSFVNRLIPLTRPYSPSTADAAIFARYNIIDKKNIEQVYLDQVQKVEQLEDNMQEVVDSSAQVIAPLCELALNAPEIKRQRLALEALGRRMNRDREFLSGEVQNQGAFKVYHCESFETHEKEKGGKKKRYRTLTLVLDEYRFRNFNLNLSGQDKKTQKSSGELEIITLVQDVSPLAALPEEPPLKATGSIKSFTIGWLKTGQTREYRTWFVRQGQWVENTLARGFSPLEFRELKVQRLANFNHRILYKSESVTLLESEEKSNPGDKRLFALGSFSDPVPEWDGENISRMVMFESVFMDALSAMRAAQARYPYRLQWNRIILHNRSLQSLTLRQLQDYGHKMLPMTHELGLENLTIYTRRKRWYEHEVKELELVMTNISQDQFTLRSRKPSINLLKSRDSYTDKVIRARQRHMVYPYEFLKMISYAGLPLYRGFPRGEFEEYDIHIDHEGNQKPVSVKGRAYGNNRANVVFGVIRHPHKDGNFSMERVIVLSDPTKDLGSLAEEESRRVIAALDLAEERDIPLEWLPISSGAKIDMKTGTENLDWTARALKRIISFTQTGGEINIIVAGVNVGAQSYWNAESTMLMHTKGLLIMTNEASMLLTGKKALDFSGSVSGESNLDIGGAEKIMDPNGQSQIRARNLAQAYRILLAHYNCSYRLPGQAWPPRLKSKDAFDRDITSDAYRDFLGQGFSTIGDIFSRDKNPERKKPFDIRQVMRAVTDRDSIYLERWQRMKDADTAIVWESRIGGMAVGIIGMESRPLNRIGAIPHDGPDIWNGGTLFPQSSRKVARGINAFSGRLPLVIMANLSGFDGSPESLREKQLEYGGEIGRAIVNFKGPIAFLAIARYHGGAYVVFSKALNPNLKAAALEGSFASVLGGAPAAAVVFPREVQRESLADERVKKALENLEKGECSPKEYDDVYQKVYNEKQRALAQNFDKIHSVKRARTVGSIDDIIKPSQIRPYLIRTLEQGMKSS